MRWNDFQNNISQTFSDLREVEDFTDVTLACEDDQQVETHKIILSASSPFFMNLLKKNKHNHPMIYMRGIKSTDLISVLDFMYHGQVNVYQEDLQDFLALAQELQLKGLGDVNNKVDEEKTERVNKPPKKRKSPERELEQYMDGFEEEEKQPDMEHNGSGDRPGAMKMEPAHESRSWVAAEGNEYTEEMASEYPGEPNLKVFVTEGGLEELDLQIASMMERGDDHVWTCKVCGKKATKGGKPDMRDHIEANHVEGISHPCTICGKTYKTRNSLKSHKSTSHRIQQHQPSHFLNHTVE